MIPSAFEYHTPKTIPAVLELLQELPQAKLLAGGQSLLPMMKLRLLNPPHIIDLRHLETLRSIRYEDGELVVGALTTHWMVESSDVVRKYAPLLAETASQIGDVQVRNIGTIGGNLAHADPAADYPAAVLALDARMVVEGPRGRRTIAAAEFFAGVFATALSDDEVLVEIRVPARAEHTEEVYLKFPHPASGFAIVGVAVVLRFANNDMATRVSSVDCSTCDWLRVGVTGVSSRPFRATGVEEILRGRCVDESTTAAAAEMTACGQILLDDIQASSDYRTHLAKVYTQRALFRAAEGAKKRTV